MPESADQASAPPRPARLYYGWVVLALSTLCIFFAAGVRSLYAVFYVAQVHEFGWSRGAGSAPYAVTLLLLVGGTPLMGALLDRWGPRVVFSLALASIAAGLGLGVYVHTPWQLAITFGLFAGIGFTSNAMPLHGSVLVRWFSRRRGLAIGIASSGMGIAQAVLSPFAQYVISGWGWRTAYLLLAGLTALLAPVVLVLFKPDPHSAGQHMDGLPPRPGRVITARRKKGSRRTLEVRDPVWAGSDWTLARAVRTRAFWGVMGVSVFQSYALHVIGVHAVALLVDAGFSRTAASGLYGVMGLGLTFGLIFWGSISDRTGRESAYTLGTLFALAGIAGLGLLTPAAGLAAAWACALVLGLGLGSRPTLFSLIAADIFQGRQAGLILGLAAAGFGLGGTAGSISAGMIFDRTGSYAGALWLCALTLVLSAASAWVAGPGRVRRPVVRKRRTNEEPFSLAGFGQ